MFVKDSQLTKDYLRRWKQTHLYVIDEYKKHLLPSRSYIDSLIQGFEKLQLHKVGDSYTQVIQIGELMPRVS